jgi:hypothetical protein
VEVERCVRHAVNLPRLMNSARLFSCGRTIVRKALI